MGIRFTGIATAATCAALAALPATASAETTCTFSPSSGALEVDTTTQTSVARASGDRVEVADWRQIISGRPPSFGYVPIPCADADNPGATAEPTLTTTASVNVRGPYLVLGTLGPGVGTSGEGPAPEIETTFSGSTLATFGGAGADNAVFGLDAEAGGPAGNLNAGEETGGNADTDVIAPNLRSVTYSGSGGADRITGLGGGPIESPLPAGVNANWEGGDGNDFLEAGLGPTRLNAGFGAADDNLRGGPSDDVLTVSNGNGDLIGGDGTDRIEFFGAPGVTVDLRVTTPQDTGRGIKLIQGVENVTGSLDPDTLIGDAVPNVLNGYSARDAIQGLEGDDELLGGDARDRINGGIGNDTADGGIGNDRVVGGPGDDTLRGYAGVDVLLGEAGADLLRAREPRPSFEKPRPDRRIDCGPGSGDRAVKDKIDPEPRSC